MKKLFFSACAIIFMASCSPYLSPYTARLQKDAQLDESQLKQIQFYISNDIVLYRNINNAETEITEGELKVVNGRDVEEVIIKSGTPGLITGKDDKGNLLVSFDADGNALRFGINHNISGYYTLMAKDWDGRTGIVDYGNKEYKTSSGSIYAYLMISMKQVNNTPVQSREATGRSLNP